MALNFFESPFPLFPIKGEKSCLLLGPKRVYNDDHDDDDYRASWKLQSIIQMSDVLSLIIRYSQGGCGVFIFLNVLLVSSFLAITHPRVHPIALDQELEYFSSGSQLFSKY